MIWCQRASPSSTWSNLELVELTLFLLLVNKCEEILFSVDLVVLGTGAKVERVDPAIRSYLQRKGISLEIQDTVSGLYIIYTM